MSTSVYSSARPLLTSNNQEIKRFILPKEQKVSRRLFGPVDPQATKKFIDEEMKKMIVIKSELWNFDFKQERNLDPNGLYDWRPVTPKKQIRPIKRRNGSDLDNSDQYCHIPEFEVIKPRPVRFGSSPSSVRNAQQSRITGKKRIFCCFLISNIDQQIYDLKYLEYNSTYLKFKITILTKISGISQWISFSSRLYSNGDAGLKLNYVPRYAFTFCNFLAIIQLVRMLALGFQ